MGKQKYASLTLRQIANRTLEISEQELEDAIASGAVRGVKTIASLGAKHRVSYYINIDDLDALFRRRLAALNADNAGIDMRLVQINDGSKAGK